MTNVVMKGVLKSVFLVKWVHRLAWSGSILEMGQFFKKSYQNKSLLYFCIMKFPSHMTENPDCNYTMAYSQTRSIYHGFIVIFFLANIICELLSIINPRNTLIWSKYECWKSIFDWKIDPLHECLVQIFFKDFVQIYIWGKKLWNNFCILLLLSLSSVWLPNIMFLDNLLFTQH